MLRRRSLHALLALLAVMAFLASASPAAAYVRTLTDDTNVPTYWAAPRVTLELARPPEGFSVTIPDFQASAQAAVRTWSFPTLECAAVDLTISPTLVDDQRAAFDGHNRVVIRTTAWCHDPVLLTKCYDDSLIAVTTVVTRSNPGHYNDGEILEADVELNSVDYSWSVIPDGDGSLRDYINDYDVASVLTHEAGHVLGFAHTCLTAGEAQRFDDQGNPSPPCTDVAAGSVGDSTMFPFIQRAEIRARRLSPDDLSAACRTYNVAARPEEGMCQVGRTGGGPEKTGLLGVLACLALLAGRAKRGRRSVQSVARAATLRKDS